MKLLTTRFISPLLTNQEGNIPIIIIFVALLVGMFLTGGILPTRKPDPNATGPEVIVLENVPINKENLHLDTLKIITVTQPPPPTGAPPSYGPECFHFYSDNCNSTNCCGGCINNSGGNAGSYWANPTGDPSSDFWCDAKPVVYLYPERETLVNVAVEVPGKVIVSDPLYPEGGWKNVLAYPDGKLIYNGEEYKELFYEAEITPITPPQKGYVVDMLHLESTLSMMVAKLGLNQKEKHDFLSFWVPKLKNLKSPYMMISVFDQQSKLSIDKVNIDPKPDVFIEFIMYYKPLRENMYVAPLDFPTAPERKGFTAVEWGGIIDQ